MRFANLSGRAVVLTDAGAVDVERASDGRIAADPRSAFECWDALRSWAATLGDVGGPYDPALLEAPVPVPRQVFAIGLNYADHAAEASIEAPLDPPVFTKFPSCIVGPNAQVALPSEHVDWEVELVVAIGAGGHRLRADEAWDAVAGVTIGQDLSERVVQMRPPMPQFSLGKSYPGFGPIGPWLVTVDELDDPDELALGCSINGEVVQDSSTSAMIFPVSELLARVSAITPLLPGDLIFTGTPAGVGVARTPPRFLRPGDRIESTIAGVGRLVTQVEDAAGQDEHAGAPDQSGGHRHG